MKWKTFRFFFLLSDKVWNIEANFKMMNFHSQPIAHPILFDKKIRCVYKKKIRNAFYLKTWKIAERLRNEKWQNLTWIFIFETKFFFPNILCLKIWKHTVLNWHGVLFVVFVFYGRDKTEWEARMGKIGNAKNLANENEQNTSEKKKTTKMITVCLTSSGQMKKEEGMIFFSGEKSV